MNKFEELLMDDIEERIKRERKCYYIEGRVITFKIDKEEYVTIDSDGLFKQYVRYNCKYSFIISDRLKDMINKIIDDYEVEIERKKRMKGTFISEWNSGETVVKTKATLNEKTGKVVSSIVDIEVDGVLTREIFRTKTRIHFKVCPTCHEYIINDDGKCFNSECI